MKRWTIFLVVVCGLIVASCGTENSSATTQQEVASTAGPTSTTNSPTTTVAQTTTSATATPTPLQPVPADHVGVTGTAECSFPEAEEFTVICEVGMSDPRVSGTEVSSNYHFFGKDEEEQEDESAAAGVWVADAVLTNDEGTWRGVTQAADDTTPCGESHYVGEGAYEGFEFHYYFCHANLDEPAELRGWIYRSG